MVWTGPGSERLSPSDVYEALLGSNRGLVKLPAIAAKMEFRLIVLCEASTQFASMPDPLCW
jgi:hypothetical protein